ncbi:MAG: pilus assembly protein PilM [Nitrospirota bacterium]|nr:pilus assembly protein PilM [Nitrospirota bacterium]
MRQTILGLDIGTASVKGVRMTRNFRGVRLLDVFEAPVVMSETEPPEQGLLDSAQMAALSELVEQGQIKKGDLIALSISGDFISTRELTLPFSDLKKIEQITPYEVESELPFDLEALTIDYTFLQKPLRQSADDIERGASKKETHLLVSAIQNTLIKPYLQGLAEIGIDPAWVGENPLSLVAYARYFLGLKKGSETETLLVDVGASRTVLCHLRGASLNWVRTIPLGGDDITRTMMAFSGLTWDAAEARKTEIDLSMDDPTNEQEIIELEALEKGLSALSLEIEKSVRIFSPESKQDVPQGLQDEAQDPVWRVFHLCGGGSEIKGFERQLANNLEMEAVGVNLEKGGLAAGIAGIDQVPEEEIAPVYAQAFGLALQESEGPPINFRRGEFVFGKETIARRHRFVSLTMIVFFLLGLMGTDLYLHYQKKENRYQHLKGEVRMAFTEIFPNVRNVVNELAQTRTAISERQKTGAFLGLNERSPLQVLSDITLAIPETITIDVFNLVIDDGSVRIQAQTDSFESVDRIRSALLATNQFKQVEMSDAKVAANKAHVRFRIKMAVRDAEE